MRAATAATDITPAPGDVLQGHLSDNPSHTVLHPLEVRALVLEQDGERVAIVALDAIAVTAGQAARIGRRVAAETGIEPDHLMLACSHTHCAPAMLPMGTPGPSASFVAAVEDQSARCVATAASDLQPVRLGLGCGSAHFNVNRRPPPGFAERVVNDAGLVDRRVRVLRIDGADDTPLAVLFHYACHPTTKPGSEGYISSDYPGIARRQIESALGVRALFLPGCFGNVRPAIVSERGGFAAATAEQLAACGQELGHEVCRVVRSLRTEAADRLSARVTTLALPYARTRPRDELAELTGRRDALYDRLLATWAADVLARLDAGGIASEARSTMQRVCVGPLALVTIPGEPVQEIGHAIEKRCRGALGCHDIWPVGYTNDMLGYLCTPLQHEVGGYEPNAYPYFDQPAPFDGEAERIVQTAAELLAS